MAAEARAGVARLHAAEPANRTPPPRGVGQTTLSRSEMREQDPMIKARRADKLQSDGASRMGASPRVASSTRRATSRTQDIDRHVGARVRERRIMLGLTQQQLADLIGVTYQQAHKYERGINRVSAGRLFEVAQVLSVPVSYFFG